MEHSPIKPIRSITGKEFILPKITQEEFKGFINYDMPFEQYLGSKEYISSSAINTILNKSPFYFLQSWCGLMEEEDKDYYRFGKAVHMALLEPKRFRDLFVLRPEFGRSKMDQSLKKKFYEENKENVILTEKEMSDLLGMIDAIQEDKRLHNIFKQGKSEVTIMFKHNDVMCRARPDYIWRDGDNIWIIDLKTTQNGDPEKFKWSVENFGYLVQQAFYKQAYETVTGENVFGVNILAIEKSFPYDFYIHTLFDEDLERGKKRFEHGLEIYKRCRFEDKWPRRQVGASMLHLPFSDYDKPLPEYDYGE